MTYLDHSKWWTFHLVIYFAVALVIAFLDPHPVLIILSLYFISALWDFQKAVAIEKYGWKNIDQKYIHENGWHLKTTAIWLIPMLVLSFFDIRYLTGFILFWLEDHLYYLLKVIVYRKWLPDELPWLLEFDSRFKIGSKNINLTLPPFPLKMTKRLFLILTSVQIFIFVLIWSQLIN